MTECSDPKVTGTIIYNRKKILLPTPFSRDYMLAAHSDKKITDFELSSLSGPTEAVNELLDFSVDRVADDYSLNNIILKSMGKEVAEIEPEILTVLASNAGNLKNLYIQYMDKATEQVKQALAVMVLDIIQIAPP